MQGAATDNVSLAASDSVEWALPLDSLLQNVAEKPVLSLFENHELQVQNDLVLLERDGASNGFVFTVFFVCAAIIIYLQRNSDNIFSSILKASFDQNQALQDARVENSQRTRNLLILQLLGLISIALFFAGGITAFFDLQLSIERVFFISIGLITSFILLKKLTLWLLAQVFELRSELRIYHFNLNILQSVAGLVLLPVTLILFYSPQVSVDLVFYVGIAIGMFFYLKGIQRGLMLAFNSPTVSSLHLFYYLCALEILPVFVMIRIVQGLQ